MIGRLSSEQAENILLTNHIGRLGCRDGEMIYVVPINYIYDGTSIFCHSVMGTKIEMMRKYPKICFQVDEIAGFTEWKSVIARGEYQELTNDRDRQHAMGLFVDLRLRLKISETAVDPESSETRVHPRSAGQIKPVLYKIVISEMTGRYEGASNQLSL